MPRFVIALTLHMVCTSISIGRQASPDGLWQIASNDATKFLPPPSEFRNVPGSVSFLSIKDAITLLQLAPIDTNGRIEFGVPFFLPNPDGGFHGFLLVNSPLVEDPKLDSDYATYFGVGVDNPTLRTRISHTPKGLHALVTGSTVAYMVERAFEDDASIYTSHSIEDLPRVINSGKQHCGGSHERIFQNLASPYSSSQMKQARIAIVARPAFCNLQDQDGDGQDERFVNTKAYIQDVVSDMALVYEIDFGLKLIQVAEPYRSQIIYIDPYSMNCFNFCISDPYCTLCGVASGDDLCFTCENRRILDDVVGFSRYDIGHMFSHLGGYYAPGLATHSDQFSMIDCIVPPQDQCILGESTHKARSICTWSDDPTFASYFWIDYVAHEIAHTVGAEHTFNSPGCGEIRPDATSPAPVPRS